MSTSWLGSTTVGSWPSASGTSLATAFHPELAGETRFHRLLATMAAEHDDPGEGSGRRPPPDPAHRQTRLVSVRSGKVRVARLTDLAALGELSRLCQQETADTRSLGLPVSGPRIGVFSLFRLPLGAFRPHDLLYVYEEEDGLSGLVRVERETPRDEWTIVELDAIGLAEAGDIRFRLVQHILRDGAKRGAIRFHVACADASGNVELFMQAGFARYGEELLLYRPPGAPLPEPWTDEDADAALIRPAAPVDAVALAKLYAAVTPGPSSAWSRIGSGTGSGRGRAGGCPARASPRSSASPTSRRSFARLPAAATTGPSSTGSSRSVSPRRTSPTTSRSWPDRMRTRSRWWSTVSG